MFDKIIDRRKTKSLKWDENVLLDRFGDKDILSMWVADMDFQVAPVIKEAIIKEANTDIYGYSLPGESYYNAIINWYDKRFDWQIKKEWLIGTPGIVTALGFVLDAYLKAGDQVLIQEPVYFPFRMMIENHDLTTKNNALVKNTKGYHINFEDFEMKVKDPKTKMFILCSPHNPIGRVWSEDDLNRMADLCVENDVLIFADEIHHDLVYNKGSHTVLAKLCKRHSSHIITATAPSKTFNLAGMQTSHLIIEDETLRAAYERVLERIHLTPPNPLALAAVEAAYTFGDVWLDDLLDYLKININHIDEFLKLHLPKAIFYKPQGNYLAWIDLNAYESDSKLLNKKLVEKGKIALNNGMAFGQLGSGFVRLNFACPKETLLKGLECLKSIVEE